MCAYDGSGIAIEPSYIDRSAINIPRPTDILQSLPNPPIVLRILEMEVLSICVCYEVSSGPTDSRAVISEMELQG